MDKHKIIFRILIIIAVFACLTSVYCSNPQPDNIVKIEGIEFNTSADSNVTTFKLFNSTDFDDGSFEHQYVDENFTGYNIFIWNLSVSNDTEWNDFVDYVANELVDCHSETINGVVIYNTTAGQGEHAGEQRFESYVVSEDLKTIIQFSTPDPNETAKLQLSLRFI